MTKVFSRESKLMFGQVREDAAVDLFLLEQVPDAKRVFVVASGGCTALSLVAGSDCRVDALDISRSQIALTELKAKLFEQKGFQSGREACTQDATRFYDLIRTTLTEDSRQLLDMHRGEMKSGLNNVGWIDQTMHRLTMMFYLLVHSKKKTEKFLSLTDVNAQKEFYHDQWSNYNWRAVTTIAFNRRFLALRMGRMAMELVPLDFAELMVRRLERALTRTPNRFNPYLWQSFFGRYSSEEDGLPPYLQQKHSERLIANIKNLHLFCEDMVDWLKEQEADSIDYFGLSNVLELLPPEYSHRLVEQLIRCGRAGSIVCVRSIFPRRKSGLSSGDDFRALLDPTGTVKLDRELTSAAEERDRSLFCNFYEVYRR